MKFLWTVQFSLEAEDRDDAEEKVRVVFEDIAGDLGPLYLLDDRVTAVK